jgi:phage baseplate assembly protein W
MSTLTWPLRLAANGTLAAVEQDTDADIDSCVTAILSYPVGWRDDSPSFGRPRLAFREGGVDIGEISRALGIFEPRVTPEIVAQVIGSDGSENVTVNVGSQNG